MRLRFGLGSLLLLVLISAIGMWMVTQYATQTIYITVVQNNLYVDSFDRVSGNLTLEFTAYGEEKGRVAECSVHRLNHKEALELKVGSEHRLKYRARDIGLLKEEDPGRVFLNRTIIGGRNAELKLLSDFQRQGFFKHYLIQGRFGPVKEE